MLLHQNIFLPVPEVSKKTPGLVKSEPGAHESAFGERQAESRSEGKTETVLQNKGSNELRRYGELGVSSRKKEHL